MSTQSTPPHTQDFKEVGKLIKSFRLEKGFKSEDFARMLNISYPTLSRIENGHQGPSVAVVAALSELGMDTEELTYSARPHSKEQTLSYRLAKVENELAKLQQTLKSVLVLLSEQDIKKGE